MMPWTASLAMIKLITLLVNRMLESKHTGKPWMAIDFDSLGIFWHPLADQVVQIGHIRAIVPAIGSPLCECLGGVSSIVNPGMQCYDLPVIAGQSACKHLHWETEFRRLLDE